MKTKYPDDNDKLKRMSIIQETPNRHVNMAFLSVVGSHRVNGVSEIHSDLLTKTL